MNTLAALHDWIRRGRRPVAFSIRQPWTWAILRAGCDVHNTKLPTPFRGPVLLHAGKGDGQDAYDAVAAAYGLPPSPEAAAIPMGGIVGAVMLHECVTRPYASRWFFGPFGYAVDYPVELPFVPMRGRQGFFEVDPEILKGVL